MKNYVSQAADFPYIYINSNNVLFCVSFII